MPIATFLPPSGETDGQEEETGQGVRMSHLAPGGRKGPEGRGEGGTEWEIIILKDYLAQGVLASFSPHCLGICPRASSFCL